jgi:hypothetical protein
MSNNEDVHTAKNISLVVFGDKGLQINPSGLEIDRPRE